jgi:hypothetical protein
LLAASGQEQELVLVYAVAVFVSFLAGLTAMFRFSVRDRRYLLTAVNAAGAIAVAFTLIVNLARGYPLISLAASALIAAGCTGSGAGPAGQAESRTSNYAPKPRTDNQAR